MKNAKGPSGAKRLTVEEELSACPSCGYDAGFHVAFLRKERRLEVILVCPSCRARFRAGDWTIPSGKPRPFDPEIDIGP